MPVPGEGVHQAQRALGVPGPYGALQRGAHVRVLGVETAQPAALSVTAQMRLGALGQRRVVRAVPAPQRGRLARLAEPFGGVRGDRLQHPVAGALGAGRALGHDQQRAVHQPGEEVENVRTGGAVTGVRTGRAVTGVPGAAFLRRRERAAVGVHGQAPQHRPLLVAQQLPAPVDHRP